MALHDRDYMRDSPSRQLWRGPTAFQILLGLNTAVFVAQHVFGLFGQPWHDGTYPYGGISVDGLGRGEIWTVFTHMFVHGGLGHFFLNMIMLWFGGRGVQEQFGGLHLVLIYLISGIVGAAAEMTVNGILQQDTATVLIGASASAFGLLTALGVAMPAEEITAFIYFIIPVKMRLWTLVKALVLLQLVAGLMYLVFDFMPAGLKIAYFAHLGGAAAGWFYARSLGYGGRPMTYASQWQSEPLLHKRRPEMVRARKRQVMDLEDQAPTPQRTAPSPAADPVDSIMEEVNPLLDKIHLHGKDSLTEDERRRLERASAEINKHRHG